MHIQAPHCPACGAPLEVPEGVSRVTCEYCRAVLVIEGVRVSGHRAPAPREPKAKRDPYPEPDVTLSSWQAERFELSFLEQQVTDSPPQVFVGFELGQRFAVVWLRVVDEHRKPVRDVKLDAAFEALRDSLGNDSDPGLAANLALETLCQKPFNHRLECAVLLFDPARMHVLPYVAGCPNALAWLSSEEGRCISGLRQHDALERRHLREASDQFENGAPIVLAANDLVTIMSAGVTHRGGEGYGECLYELQQTLNGHLGEEPLRVVTLVKNTFWDHFQLQHGRDNVGPPVGPVQVAAVRAVLPPMVATVPAGFTPTSTTTRRFELSALTKAGDLTQVVPLHDDRQVLVWANSRLGPMPAEQFSKLVAAVTAVLDKKNHGDNENPRRAGREALEAIGSPGDVRLAVVQLFDKYGRVKWFRHGWHQPVSLGARGVRVSEGQQQFDEGGEGSVGQGERLFFPGALRYADEVLNGEQLAKVWHGGKASRLYEALNAHWKTKKTPVALEAVARAALADQPDADLTGLLLVTGLG